MKARSEIITGDGFDKNVAEKMPKMRRVEEATVSDLEGDLQPQQSDGHETVEMQPERKVTFESPRDKTEIEKSSDVLRLIEDLHTQLLVSGRTKRALEMDLTSYQKTVHQLAEDNKDLRSQVEDLRKELQRYREIESESIYIKEENSDALERVQEFQQELRGMNEALSRITQERDEALSRVRDLESQLEENEVLRGKGKLKEREASHFYEETRELQTKLEQALAQNMDLERRYEALKKSFHEVRESLTVLRDSCKSNYYNLSETPE